MIDNGYPMKSVLLPILFHFYYTNTKEIRGAEYTKAISPFSQIIIERRDTAYKSFIGHRNMASILLCWLHVCVDVLYVVEVFELFNHLVDGLAFFFGNVL